MSQTSKAAGMLATFVAGVDRCIFAVRSSRRTSLLALTVKVALAIFALITLTQVDTLVGDLLKRGMIAGDWYSGLPTGYQSQRVSTSITCSIIQVQGYHKALQTGGTPRI